MDKAEILAIRTKKTREIKKILEAAGSSIEFVDRGRAKDLIEKYAAEADKKQFKSDSKSERFTFYVIGPQDAIGECVEAFGSGADPRVLRWTTYLIEK